jgi:hypothetical protein
MMFRSFIAWLDSYISREEPSSILKAMIGLMTFAGLLGTIFGNQAIRVGAFVVVAVFVVSVILIMLADRRRLHREHETDRELLARYCEFVIDNSSDPLFSVKTWTQTVYVDRNGDVREVLVITATALRERVYFLRLTAKSKWDQPERHRRRVKIVARGLTVNGQSGPRWNVTTTWDSVQRLTSILHLHEPIKGGEEIILEVVRTWPAKCRPLMREGVAENFSLRTTSLLEVQRIEYCVVLPHGYNAVYERIGHTDPNVGLTIESEPDKEGRSTFRWCANCLPSFKEVGIRLELE